LLPERQHYRLFKQPFFSYWRGAHPISRFEAVPNAASDPYPTSAAILVTEVPPDAKYRQASSMRQRGKLPIGDVPVIALKC